MVVLHAAMAEAALRAMTVLVQDIKTLRLSNKKTVPTDMAGGGTKKMPASAREQGSQGVAHTMNQPDGRTCVQAVHRL